MSVSIPSGWSELDVSHPQRLAAFQETINGPVVAVEEGTTSDRYATVVLPSNFMDDNRPIQRYGENGYLYSGDSKDEAYQKAKEFMNEQ